MDIIDRSIVERLTEDARTSFRRIAKELRISPDTVIKRYKKLLRNGVIRGSTVVIDPKKIGYQGMAAFLIEASPSHILATDGTIDSSLILDRLIQMPSIILATKTVGDYDLLAVGVAMDFEHLFDIGSYIARIPGVKNLEVSFWVEKKGLCPKYFIV